MIFKFPEAVHTNDVGHSAAVTEASRGMAVAVVDAVGVEVGLGQRQWEVVVVSNVHQRVSQYEKRRCSSSPADCAHAQPYQT